MRKNEEKFLKFVKRGIFKVYKNGKIYALMVSSGGWNVIYKKRKKNRLLNGKFRGKYNVISFKNKGKTITISVHRAIWICFNGEIPEELEINHKNGIKTDNKLSNLELVTRSENAIHAYQILKRKHIHGEEIGSKLKKRDIIKIREMLEKGLNQRYIAKFFKVTQSTICAINTKRTWSWL